MDDAMVREVRITRIFDAPRELVWAAWTEAEQLAKWFMPHGFTVPECEIDLRPEARSASWRGAPTARRCPSEGSSGRSFHRSASSSRRPRSTAPTVSR